MSTKRKSLLFIVAFIFLVAFYFAGAWLGWYGNKQNLRSITEVANPQQAISSEKQKQAIAKIAGDTHKQVLFGDLHVHTTFSMDAFQNSLPIMQGEGVHPPADACNFARFCSALDFYSINDHAESLTQERWQQTKQSIQQCNAVAGNSDNPDMVAFLGWEWTQIGKTAESHFGHKNVVLRDFADDLVPTRPISAKGQAFDAMRSAKVGALKIAGPLLDFENRQEFYDIDKFVRDTQAADICPDNVHVKDLPLNCLERAATPAQLFEKLSQWDMPAIVIPHGTAWGNTAPAGSDWQKQLSQGNHDAKYQTAIEIFSGHGNSEEYRPWRGQLITAAGEIYCPEPSDDYIPECWQAGKIIEKRCLAESESPQECALRAETARNNVLIAGKQGFKTIPGSTAEEWQDAGQCKDCYLPTYNHRPGMSAQAALAIRNFNQGEGEAERFKFGFIGSSDNHSAKAGTGYKELNRFGFTDTHGPRSTWLYNKMRGKKAAVAESVPLQSKGHSRGSNKERSNSFMFTGGLAGVHSQGRDRQAIWDAIKRNEVYSTSGPRIMLWFELLNGPDDGHNQGIYPMGQSLAMNKQPTFRVKALGAFKQKPGCPEFTLDSLGQNELERLCKGECYNPSDQRHPIVRIEIVKITPQNSPDESLDSVIHDVWKSFDCPADGYGCTVEFSDADFSSAKRDSLYYARAIQQATPTINGGTLQCQYDEQGQCVKVNACYVDDRTNADDNCLADSEHRAWSSPVFIDHTSI
ncbi:MAG: DUF3604 domain-containing protein [Colwellia sp.]|nr:DUF3604 domain-containing protein [Colwellia sp.]MCW8863636.1 DUF3604 domain-containing protein [Colwellia sp.]MCW9080396.1 DUF3604 domain-containing protein [Colwellia sp.]